MYLSICIPTFNRSQSLKNCLNSIILNKKLNSKEFEICVLDNCSNDETKEVVDKAKEKININYKKNQTNIGRVKNYLQVVEMAKGDFVWLIGDDDLLMTNAVSEVIKLIQNFSDKVDFFYINSFILESKYIFAQPQPFNTNYLPDDMKTFSKNTISGEIQFIDLISPRISFDFLGGMYLAVFKREKWLMNTACLNSYERNDTKIFSYFGNTFPHLKVFANAFAESRAYFYAQALSVTLSGEREWAPMYPLVRSIRLIEALDEFKKNGLSTINYIYCKNYALRYFAQDIIKMFLYKKISGFEYINFRKHILKNILYPNLHLSFFYFFLRKIKIIKY